MIGAVDGDARSCSTFHRATAIMDEAVAKEAL
jgi:hypothetical protein